MAHRGSRWGQKDKKVCKRNRKCSHLGAVGAMEIFLQEEKDSGQFFRKVSGFGASPLPES